MSCIATAWLTLRDSSLAAASEEERFVLVAWVSSLCVDSVDCVDSAAASVVAVVAEGSVVSSVVSLIVKLWPIEILLASWIPFFETISSTVVPFFLAIAESVSPFWTV